MRHVGECGSTSAGGAPPWWDGPVRRAPAGPSPALPWSGGTDPGHPSTAARTAGTSLRMVVLLAVGVLAGVAALVLGMAALGVSAAARGTGGTVTTPFLSYTPPPGWSVASADPDATRGAPALVGVVHGPRYRCGGEELVRGFAGAALLPTDATAGPADRAERVARWFAATTFAAADGTPPDVTVAPPRSVQVAGPDGPVDGTVTEAVVRAPAGRSDCTATAGRVLVLAVPADGGAALLLVAGDSEGGPAEPAPTPSVLDAVVESAQLRAT